MASEDGYPGTPAHQALLRVITAYYRGDPRIRSLAVFGSLGRGNWDAFSDLDLNAVIADGVELDVPGEVRALCDALAAIGERAALIAPHGADAADVVFASLAHLSIRYHPLSATSPNIVESLLPLTGPLDAAAVRAAGLARRETEGESLAHVLDVCVRAALYVDIGLQRGQLWSAIAELHRMREMVIELFSATRGGARAIRVFQAEASAELRRALGATLPHYDAGSIQTALGAMLELLERDIEVIAAGRLALSDGQRAVIAGVRARQAGMGQVHPPVP
jgi:predicted nucleotidyltransferase